MGSPRAVAIAKTIPTSRVQPGWERSLVRRMNGDVAQNDDRVTRSRIHWPGFADDGIGSRRRRWWRWRWWRWWPRRRWRLRWRWRLWRWPRRWLWRWRLWRRWISRRWLRRRWRRRREVPRLGDGAGG